MDCVSKALAELIYSFIRILKAGGTTCFNGLNEHRQFLTWHRNM